MMQEDFDESIFKKSPYIRTSIGYAIATVLSFIILIAAAITLLIHPDDDDAFVILALAIFALVTFAGFFIANIVKGIAGRSKVNKYLSEHDKDEILAQLQNARYVCPGKKFPMAIFTDTFVFDVGSGIYDGKDIDFVYSYRKGAETCIKVNFINGKVVNICKNVNIRSGDAQKCLNALGAMNPDMLLGYMLKNIDEHKRRVKEYKANR